MKKSHVVGKHDGIVFTTSKIAKLINCNQKTIRLWIKDGYLGAKWDEEEKKWIITETAFVKFLYYNPKYRRKLEQNQLTGFNNTLKNVILNTVYHKTPVMVDLTDLANIFSVSEDTVRTWLKRKSIQKTRSKFAIFTRVYSLNAVMKFFNENPYYKKTYGPLVNYITYLKKRDLDEHNH